MSGTGGKGHLSAIALVAPLFLFIAVFFLWPLGTMMSQAVSDTAVLRILPQTAKVAANWDPETPPTAEMKEALAADLRAADDRQAVGDMTRRLNSAQPGFRTLMSRTTRALRKDDAPRFPRSTNAGTIPVSGRPSPAHFHRPQTAICSPPSIWSAMFPAILSPCPRRPPPTATS